MKIDKVYFLIILQFISIVALILPDISNILRWALFVVLMTVTIIFFFNRRHFILSQKSIASELKRAINGNLATRLYTKHDGSLDEVIFSINELIEQLEKVQVESIKSEVARNRLFSSISHDIRTPLTSIIGYIDALKDNIATSKEEKLKYLEIISQKSNSLKGLIDDIFHMAKLDADEFILKKEPLDLTELMRECLIEFLPELNKLDIELCITIPDHYCSITADRLTITRILGNILKNAVLYGKDGNVLGVELIETTSEYQVLIWDQGPGISKEDLENVFDRMYRSDHSRNSVYGGSGLGLAITKALVEKSGGIIWAESEPWKKTTFGFSLPKSEY